MIFNSIAVFIATDPHEFLFLSLRDSLRFNNVMVFISPGAAVYHWSIGIFMQVIFDISCTGSSAARWPPDLHDGGMEAGRPAAQPGYGRAGGGEDLSVL